MPTLYNAMLNREGAGDYDLSSIRLCVSAAEASPPASGGAGKRCSARSFSTASARRRCCILQHAREIKPGSSGKPVPGYEAKILDEAGYPVEPGEAGYLGQG